MMTGKPGWTVSEDGRGRYSLAHPYVMRDQGLRAADDMVRVVIGDVADVLLADGRGWMAVYAYALYGETERLDWDDRGNWVEDEDEDGASGSESLRWMLEDAEQIPGVSVEWNADCGTVWTTIADKWEWLDDDIPGSFNDDGEYRDADDVEVDW